jgi:hypothetical protein
MTSGSCSKHHGALPGRDPGCCKDGTASDCPFPRVLPSYIASPSAPCPLLRLLTRPRAVCRCRGWTAWPPPAPSATWKRPPESGLSSSCSPPAPRPRIRRGASKPARTCTSQSPSMPARLPTRSVHSSKGESSRARHHGSEMPSRERREKVEARSLEQS